MLKRTPLFETHQRHGARLIDFGGWEMPVQYSTITLEHNAVRKAVGVFDISHMGQIFVWGKDAESYLQYLTTNDVRKATVGKGIYAHLLNEKGGVIDDIFIYRLEEEKFLVIINASRADVDQAWMKKQKGNFEVEIVEAPFPAALAVQGPKAVEVLGKLSSRVSELPRFGISELEFGEISSLVARTGYTGEDGFELFAPAGHLLQIWPALFKAGQTEGLLPCGLGARDTLRTEVAYPLYGHELDETHTPFQARLSWVVKLEKGDFIGREALLKQKSSGFADQLYGFKVESGGVARPGGTILINNKEVGKVASGTFSPSLNYSIGMAYLPVDVSEEGAPLTILQGARELKASTVKMPFYRKPVNV
jgi:aminomethyltransferase